MKQVRICLSVSLATLAILVQPAFAAHSRQHTPSQDVRESQEEVTTSDVDPSLDESRPSSKGRELNHHAFLQTSIVSSPFVSDEVGMTFSGGALSFSPDEQNSLHFVGFSPAIQLKKSITSWVALSVGLNATLLAATTSETAGTLTESALYAVEPGLLVKVFRTDAQTLALSMSASYGNTYSLSPATGLQNVNNTGVINLNSLLVKSTETSWNPGLRYAAAFFDMVGVELESKVMVSSVTNPDSQDSKTETSLRTGASVSFDMKPRTPIPLGFALGYAHDFGLSQKASDMHNIEMGVYETISRNFNFGGAFTMNLASITNLYSGALSMRYYY